MKKCPSARTVCFFIIKCIVVYLFDSVLKEKKKDEVKSYRIRPLNFFKLFYKYSRTQKEPLTSVLHYFKCCLKSSEMNRNYLKNYHSKII